MGHKQIHTDIFPLEFACEMALHECGLSSAAIANEHELEGRDLSSH
jgi:hypothetical protein